MAGHIPLPLIRDTSFKANGTHSSVIFAPHPLRPSVSAGNLAAPGVPPPRSLALVTAPYYSPLPQVPQLHGFENRPTSRRGFPPARSFQVEHLQPSDVGQSRIPVSPFLVLPGSEGIADIPIPPDGQAVESLPMDDSINRNGMVRGVDPNYQFTFTSNHAPAILIEQTPTPVVESEPRKQKGKGRVVIKKNKPAAATHENAEKNAAIPSAALAANEKVKKDRKKRKAVDAEEPNIGEGTKRKRAKVAAGKGTEMPQLIIKPYKQHVAVEAPEEIEQTMKQWRPRRYLQRFKVYTGPGGTSQKSSAASSDSAWRGIKDCQ
ncbi:hypothetical protein NLJ89_g9368 [Agrocybe chaxingu]|uniref:Uncharacterized protein n=1 Tax=Agrocybe chaxingu TaxID=84603 RepID=A0A9W8MRW4_9AGAR|nr:hypothetical protein NLJ89_g9368 [Agrocybe chaxingu]